MELVAQGVANIASPLLAAYPRRVQLPAQRLTFVPAHSPRWREWSTRYVVCHPSAYARRAFCPLATLAAVLFVVAYVGAAGDRHNLRLSRADIAIWLTTFALTVLADLTVAVGVGMALAALLLAIRN